MVPRGACRGFRDCDSTCVGSGIQLRVHRLRRIAADLLLFAVFIPPTETADADSRRHRVHCAPMGRRHRSAPRRVHPHSGEVAAFRSRMGGERSHRARRFASPRHGRARSRSQDWRSKSSACPGARPCCSSKCPVAAIAPSCCTDISTSSPRWSAGARMAGRGRRSSTTASCTAAAAPTTAMRSSPRCLRSARSPRRASPMRAASASSKPARKAAATICPRTSRR